MRGERASARGAISATPPWRYLVDFSRRRKNRQLQPESVGMDHGLTSTTLGGSTFTLASKYRPQRLVGSGSGGVVVAATCADSSNEVAIKKIHIERDLTIERHALAARRTLREISLISQLDHENVLGLLDLSCSGGGAADFDHLYLVTPLMDADLHRVIRSPQPLTEQHVQFFMWQLLRGLEHLHACAVVHRDLKPANLLVNANCDLKITDFGLSRGVNPSDCLDFLTEYVVTRWYRAPEIVLSSETYTKAVDVWSVGCIFGELLGRKPLFPGSDHVQQLGCIIDVLGTPRDAQLHHVPDKARRYIAGLPPCAGKPLAQIYPAATADALDLLRAMLDWQPSSRCTVEQALAHPYLAAFHNPAAEPVSATAFDFDASEAAASADAQQALFREVCRFRPELAAITSPPSKAKRRHPSEYGSSSPSSRNWPRYQPAAAANRGAAHRGVARG